MSDWAIRELDGAIDRWLKRELVFVHERANLPWWRWRQRQILNACIRANRRSVRTAIRCRATYLAEQQADAQAVH